MSTITCILDIKEIRVNVKFAVISKQTFKKNRAKRCWKNNDCHQSLNVSFKLALKTDAKHSRFYKNIWAKNNFSYRNLVNKL